MMRRLYLTSVCDESGSDQLTNEDCEVGGDGHHTVLEVVVQLGAVLRDLNDLIGKQGFI